MFSGSIGRLFIFAYFGVLWIILITQIINSDSCPTTTEPTAAKLFDWATYEDINFDVTRYPGEYYIVDCRLQKSEIDVSLWHHRAGKPKEEKVPDQIKLKKNGQIFNITKLTYDDEGNYYCRASNRDDKSLGYVEIASDGEAFQTPEVNKNRVYVNKSKSFRIDCKIKGWYAMNWYKNGSEILRSKDISYWENNFRFTQKRLEIKNVSSNDEGIYICEAGRPALKWKKTASTQVVVRSVIDEVNDILNRRLISRH